MVWPLISSNVTPRQAEDLFIVNLRALHPDAELSAAVDRLDRGRPAGPVADEGDSVRGRPNIEIELQSRRAKIAKYALARQDPDSPSLST
ncbi:MAG: hypothetical protein M3021_09915 [Actinomycetota bacterium]|uniref:hypothetical protein n=1 Tax=Micrococcaceae TaxID=1268 RepID=UPI0024B95BD1|nr:hypothetical protein [Paenarthrobacter sp. PH39-S1]MDJ0357560.1 hypothetical protein [Paenarthrobacter sp. PH39-S1]MDQ6740654.1 hypothetical protein [Actinomycetota bacterium]